MSTVIEHNETFDLAYRFVTETSENIFLTGKAGTGKTTFLKYLKDNSTKNIIVAAPTGVAAINAAGVTLHSLFQLPFHPFLPTSAGRDELLKKLKFNKQRLDILRKTELLVIDEISMVRCDVMDAIDTVLKSVRRNHGVPFGGVQLLCIGDLHQLPPVAQNHEWSILQEYYASPFFFDALAIKEQQPLLIQLDKIYRQKDESFVDLLNMVRTNNMDADAFDRLHDRFFPGFRPQPGDHFITLTSHNNQANLINNSEIQKLSAKPFTYQAEVEHDFPENMYPTDASLMLKEGAQVMFIKNDPIQRRYFNGKIGVVSRLENDKVVVDCDGIEIEVSKDTWENSRYSLNRSDGKLQQEVIGTFSQFPLRLAWAITIHKSQGLTFDRVMIDAASAFSSGQVYVALSRCTSLGGIVLLSKIPPGAITSNQNVDKGYKILSHSGSLADRFSGARQIFTLQLLEDIFSYAALLELLHTLRGTVATNKAKLNSDAHDTVEKMTEKLTAADRTARTFMMQVTSFMKDDPLIENNSALQKRISAAAAHFLPLLSREINLLNEQPLVTEHKEVADLLNPLLVELLSALLRARYLTEYCYGNFSVTSFLKHKLDYAQPPLKINCYGGTRKTSSSDGPNPELYDTLKRWRDIVCEEEDIPIYLVVAHSGLKDICTYLPRTKRELLLISGFGKAKVDKFGDVILEAVIDYCERTGIDSNMNAKPASSKTEKKRSPVSGKVNSSAVSLALFKTGKTIAEVAKERGLAAETVENHLLVYLRSGDLKITDVMTEKKYVRIMNVVRDRGETSLSELKQQLPDDSFGEIRMAEAAAAFTEGVLAQ